MPGRTRLLSALFWAAALFALVMALLPHPPEIPGDPIDKIQHMAAFGTVAALGAFAFPRLGRVRLFIGLSLFGATIELLQAIPIFRRDCDPLDWAADTVACGLVLLAITLLSRRQR